MSTQTTRLAMPLIQPAQAQKHVTVNELLMRLDGLVNLVLQGTSATTPPDTVADGQCWGLGGAPVGAWAGQAGRIAIAANGGWVFADPAPGMRAHVQPDGLPAIHDGIGWRVGAITLGAMGSGMVAGMIEGTVTVTAGATCDTGLVIPDGVVVIGAVARVTAPITGGLTSWRLGHATATDRFGRGLGIAQGSWARGLLGQPTAYYSPAPLVMTAEGGSFASGSLRVAVHWLELRLPGA